MPETVLAQQDCGMVDVGCEIGNAVHGAFVDVTTSIAKGAAQMMAEAMTYWTKTDRSSMLQSPAIEDIQGLLMYVGLMLLVGSIIWQGLVLMYRRKADPLVNTGFGLLSFFGWSTLGTAAAVLLYEAGLALSGQVLTAAIDKFSTTMAAAMQTNIAESVATVFFLACFLFILAAIQWVLGFFRMGALVILLALVPTAAAGQINEATKPWLRKVLSWSLSLILYQPIAAVIFAVGFVLVGEGRDIGTLLTGVAVLAMAVIAMPTMLRFFDWGGQRFVSAGSSGGGAMAAGAAATVLTGAGVGGFSRYMEQSGPAGAFGTASGASPVASAHRGDSPGSGPARLSTPTTSAGEPAGATRTTSANNQAQDGAPVAGAVSDSPRGAGSAAGGGTTSGGAAAGAASATGIGAVGGAALDAGRRAQEKLGDAMTDGSEEEPRHG